MFQSTASILYIQKQLLEKVAFVEKMAKSKGSRKRKNGVVETYTGAQVCGEVIFGEDAEGLGWRVMTNPILMEKISDYLSYIDLAAFCLASKTTKKIVDQMDSSCWRRRAFKLDAVLRLDSTITTNTTSYKQKFFINKSNIGRLANELKTKIDGEIAVSRDSIRVSKDFSQQELALTASLNHHGMLGEVSCKRLLLGNVNLSSIPIQHLGSLSACVKNIVFFGEKVIPNISVLLNEVKCDMLTFLDQTLEADETLALVRAMKTRVRIVTLVNHKGTVDVSALKTFDGKGTCEQVWLVKFDGIPIENTSRLTEDDMKKLAKTINWGVTYENRMGETIIIYRRTPEEDEDMD